MTTLAHTPEDDARMLSDADASALIEMEKDLVDDHVIQFPPPGYALKLDARGKGNPEQFFFDVNRKHGSIKLSKCTYQERHASVELLIRLDVDGPTHVNPNGEEIACPHLHIYRAGFDLKWAVPAPPKLVVPDRLDRTLIAFLRYCKVGFIPNVQRSIE
jgi:hypothetical protein